MEVDPATHIQRTVLEKFLCDHHMPQRQWDPDQHQQDEPVILDLDQQPTPSTTLREDLPSPPPPLLPDLDQSLPSLQQPTPSPPPPPSAPPLHHLPLSAPGPVRRGRKGRNRTPEEVTQTYLDIKEEVDGGKLLKEALPAKGIKYNSGHWRRLRIMAEVTIAAPELIDELFSCGSMNAIAKKATELSRRPDVQEAITAARGSQLIA